MNNLSNRLLSLAAVTTVAVLHSAGAVAAPKAGVPVFNDRAAANVSQLPRQAKAQTGVVGTLNVSAMTASAIDLTLADGQVVTARLQRVVRDDQKGTQSWIGSFVDSQDSVLVLSKVKGVITGYANYEDLVLEIMPAAAGKHVLYAVDNEKLPKGEIVRKTLKLAADTLTGTSTTAAATTTAMAGDAVVQDVLVLYTAASASRYGQASIESQIQSAIQSANQAYLNSQINITLNLVGTSQSTIVEQSNMDSTVNALQADSNTANLRNSLGADMVVLVSENSDYCGLSNLMTTNSTSFAPYAFSVVNSSCLSNQSLAHELGHQQGVMHDRESSAGWAGVYPYSYGYRRCVSDGTGFRDIMSYSCTGAPRVLIFSNPYVNYNGYAAGIAYESSPSTSAENTRSINNTASTVAAFRASKSTISTPTAPVAPSGLTMKSVTYNQVSLAWNDNSTNETGFKVERSTDGVNFTEIAALGANAVSHTDANVIAKANYYYRARAFNSIGVSASTGTITVTTLDVPPPAPTAPAGVASLNNGDGSASVSWGASSNVNSYEVRRETYSATRGTWGSATTVATVPSNFTSIADSTGAGTFRYSVRATNAGGASAYAGPAQVTVTAVTTTSNKGRKRR